MSEIWSLVVIGFWVLMVISLLVIILKMTIPYYIFSIDDVCNNKMEIYKCIVEFIEEDFGIDIQNPTIDFNYELNDEYRGYYDQNDHSIKLYLQNLENVRSFILTLVEEIHHSIFVSTKSSMKTYQSYDKKVGYENNPLEFSAKVYSITNFKSIHMILQKRGLILYRV
tara:strand:+ start:490 stop:993 length:504 start_codon:yes stop_codon:yes gene_type:complete